MRKAIQKIAILTVLLTSVFALAMSAGANTGGFSVTPNLPENQHPDTRGFFNLRVAPGQMQEITVSINNPGEEEIHVEVSLITATTNMNGIINYSTPGISDETLVHSFADLASIPGDGNITIPAGQSAVLPITLNIPAEGFEGIILGSVYVLLGISEEELAEGGMLVNRFASVTPIRLQQQEDENLPVFDFVLGGITAELVNHRAAIVAEIRNIQPRLAASATASAHIYPAGGSEPIFTISDMSVDFAPNSIFHFSLVDQAGFGIQAGDYNAAITLSHGTRIWEFEEAFTIEPHQAAAVNQAAVNQQRTPSGMGSIPLWAIIGVGAVLILLVVIVLIVKSKNAKTRELEAFHQRMMELQNKKPTAPKQPESPAKEGD